MQFQHAELTLLDAHQAMTSASCVMNRNAAIMMMPWAPTCASPILLAQKVLLYEEEGRPVCEGDGWEEK